MSLFYSYVFLHHFFLDVFSPLFLQTLFADMFIACYNVFYSSQPVLAIGIFDQDVDVDHALKYPKLYAPGLSSALFNKREFFKSALQGFISSCFLFFLSHGETTALIHLVGHSRPNETFCSKIDTYLEKPDQSGVSLPFLSKKIM